MMQKSLNMLEKPMNVSVGLFIKHQTFTDSSDDSILLWTDAGGKCAALPEVGLNWFSSTRTCRLFLRSDISENVHILLGSQVFLDEMFYADGSNDSRPSSGVHIT